MEATVNEIHTYPLRPRGYEEPLFHSQQSRREILEHLACGGWLHRASEAPRPTARRLYGRVGVKEAGRVLCSWREVDRWWEPGAEVDVVCRLVESDRGRQEVLQEPVRPEPSRVA